MTNWNKTNEMTSKLPHFVARYDGVMGRDALVGGAAELHIRTHYNGSSADAFGGAAQWPHIHLELSLPEKADDDDIIDLFGQLNEFLLNWGCKYNPSQTEHTDYETRSRNVLLRQIAEKEARKNG